jgi:hypothetical protein
MSLRKAYIFYDTVDLRYMKRSPSESNPSHDDLVYVANDGGDKSQRTVAVETIFLH